MGSLEKACFRSNVFVRGANLCLALEGVNLQFYPNFALFSRLGGMNLDHDFVQVSKLSEDQKKSFSPKMNSFFPNSDEDQKIRSSPKMEHFFSPISSGHLLSDAHQSQTIRADADLDHIQIIGWDTVKLLKDISPPIPTGFGTPGFRPAPFMNLGCNEKN